MNDPLLLLLALVAGAALGLFYFGGLWLTVRRLPASPNPGLLAFASFLARTALSLAVIYLVAGGQWERLAACLVGFILARQVLIFRLRPAARETN